MTKIVEFLVALLAPLGVSLRNAPRADNDRKAAAAQAALIAASSGAGISNMSSAD